MFSRCLETLFPWRQNMCWWRLKQNIYRSDSKRSYLQNKKTCLSKYTLFDLGLCKGWKKNNVKWHKLQLHKQVCKDIDCMSRTSGMIIFMGWVIQPWVLLWHLTRLGSTLSESTCNLKTPWEPLTGEIQRSSNQSEIMNKPDDLLYMHYLALMEMHQPTRTLSLKRTFMHSIKDSTLRPQKKKNG